MEALHGNKNKERLTELLLGNTQYNYGFEREDPLPSIEVRERELLAGGYVSDYRLRSFAALRYRHDANLGPYVWDVLLKDDVFYATLFPGTDIRGRNYELDVLHIASGERRDKWLIDGGNPVELLVPGLWAIGIMSLKNQYHKLYVHDDQPDGYNICRDGFGHRNHGLERIHLDRLLSRIDASIGRDEWDRQAKVQGVNPCIYTFVQRWVMTTLPSL